MNLKFLSHVLALNTIHENVTSEHEKYIFLRSILLHFLPYSLVHPFITKSCVHQRRNMTSKQVQDKHVDVEMYHHNCCLRRWARTWIQINCAKCVWSFFFFVFIYFSLFLNELSMFSFRFILWLICGFICAGDRAIKRNNLQFSTVVYQISDIMW